MKSTFSLILIIGSVTESNLKLIGRRVGKISNLPRLVFAKEEELKFGIRSILKLSSVEMQHCVRIPS